MLWPAFAPAAGFPSPVLSQQFLAANPLPQALEPIGPAGPIHVNMLRAAKTYRRSFPCLGTVTQMDVDNMDDYIIEIERLENGALISAAVADGIAAGMMEVEVKRLNRYATRMSDALVPMARLGMGPVPAVFPATRRRLFSLNDAHLLVLEAYYQIIPVGPTVADRREVLAKEIGCIV